MKVNEAIIKRRSIRAYLDKTVEPELIRTIFTQAQQAPSNCNTQPWLVNIISGQARDDLEIALVTEVASGKAPSPTFVPGDQSLTGIFRDRQIDCAVQLYKATGVTREDKEARNELMLRNWRFFGAPHVAIFAMPTSMSQVNSLDVGIYLQSVMLLLTENGLGSCPQGALAIFPDPIRELIKTPDDYGILCGLSFGYPDENAEINQYTLDRELLENSVSFIS